MAQKHWAKEQERGSLFFLKLTAFLVRYFPLWIMRGITFFVVSYFYLTGKQARQSIYHYQQNLKKTFPDIKLGRFSVFRQFLAFGENITDRFAVWQNKINAQNIVVDDPENLQQQFGKTERGQILAIAHFGNVEVCRALAEMQVKQLKLNVLVHHKNAEKFNQVLKEAGAETLSLIPVDQLDMNIMLKLASKIEQGEYIAIAADRVPLKGDKTCLVDFLGEKASLPQGVWLLSSLLKAPVDSIFCIKEHNHYRIKFQKICDPITGRGPQREQNIQLAAQHYANLLAKECYAYPLNWFNFYPFWQNNHA